MPAQAGEHGGVVRLGIAINHAAPLGLREPEALPLEHWTVGERDGLAQAVLQLAHVAGPRVGAQRGDGVLGERHARASELGRRVRDELCGEQRHVVGSRA
jgi:hypothetical protein